MIQRLGVFAMLVFGGILFSIPFLWTVSTALKTNEQVFAVLAAWLATIWIWVPWLIASLALLSMFVLWIPITSFASLFLQPFFGIHLQVSRPRSYKRRCEMLPDLFVEGIVSNSTEFLECLHVPKLMKYLSPCCSASQYNDRLATSKCEGC